MKMKDSHPPASFLEANAHSVIKLYYEVNQLKRLYRQGWLRRGIPENICESVAEHTFGMLILALVLTDQMPIDLDPLRVLQMVLIHDLGEIYAGDITPVDPIPPTVKHQLEKDGVENVFASLEDGETYLAMWDEYEKGESSEAVFVREIDRLEMGLQASVYDQQFDFDATEFYRSAKKAIHTPELVNILESLSGLNSSGHDISEPAP